MASKFVPRGLTPVKLGACSLRLSASPQEKLLRQNLDAVTVVAGPPAVVLIDDSSENTTCVTAFVPVICADDAGRLGNRVNSRQAGDTFEITTDGAEVCATRIGSSGGLPGLLSTDRVECDG